MPKILIVEDDASIREAFNIILRLNSEYAVTVAENGQIALDLCHKNKYDLILLDIMMPVMDGTAFLKEYSIAYPDDVSRVIIMSNLSSGSELSIIQDFGVDKSVLKSSLTPQRLMSIVADALQEQSKLKRRIDSDTSANDSDEQPVRGDSY